MARRGGLLHGVLVIDKPEGLTSHDVVARVRRLTGESRVGHAGTLDPFATGVLPVCVGQATRLVEYLSEADKAYRAEVRLGIQTDTDDRTGAIVAALPDPEAAGRDVRREELERLLDRFRGEIQQVPPAYAAIKLGGRKLYELARAGEPVEVPPRRVTITRLEVLDWAPPRLTVLVECGKGTYIRALARDIGAALGCGGHLAELRRLRTGPFTIDQARPLADLEARHPAAAWSDLALPPDSFLRAWPALTLDADAATGWRNGMPVLAPSSSAGERARVYGPAGHFLGTGRYDAQAGVWRPDKVLSLPEWGASPESGRL